MSSTTKKTIIDPEDKRLVDAFPSTADLYREVDAQLRQFKEEDKRKKRVLVKQTLNDGEELFQEIEDKRIAKEEERVIMIEYIYKNSKEKFVTLKEAKNLPYDDIKRIHNQVVENKKPMWRKIINVFR